ncbi:odorant receptor 4-like [Halyomorpha halys]|uniref:odorant receptor 4-like n=1 Tax=Halyomorpha halys TaxID=286706 RepID=UPI0034D3872F
MALVLTVQLMKVLKSLKETIGFPITIKYATTSVILCLNLFTVSTALTTSEYSGTIIAVTAIGSLGTLLLILCTAGESLEAENSELQFNLYDLPWDQFKPQDRKTLVMVLRQVGKPCCINYQGIINLNLNTYMQVINASYSYFMLLESRVT